MLRAFRVFRLFKRIESLNKLLTALATSIPGMMNAGFVMLLVTCIYGILGVNLLGKFAEGGTVINSEGEVIIIETQRGLSYGEEYFGNLGRSLYTLLQILTAESWSEAVARPAMFAENGMWLAIYFITYILLNGIILTNVVITVLLDKMLGDQPMSDAEVTAQMEREALRLARFEYEVDSLEAECRMRLDQLTEVLLGIHALVHTNGGASRNNGRSIRRRRKLVDACTAGDSATGDSGGTTAAASPGLDVQTSSPSREVSQDDLQVVGSISPRPTHSSGCCGTTTTVAVGAPSKASSAMANGIHAVGLSPEAVQLLPVVHVLAVTAAQVTNGHEPRQAMPLPRVQPPAGSALETFDSFDDILEAEATPIHTRFSFPWRRNMLHGIVPTAI